MNRFPRREFLNLSVATAAGLALAACQRTQPAPGEQAAAPPAPAMPPTEEDCLLDTGARATIEKMVQFMMDEYRVPGMAVGLTQDGQVTHTQGVGVARIGIEQPVTPQSIFQIMGTTRLFTSVAAMQLMEQGKLDLDAPIVEYLPYFRLADGRYTQITMRHLLSETAGLPLTPENMPSLDWDGKTPQTDDGALERYVRSLSDIQLIAAPGTERGRTFMCNMGFDIAGDVIAKVSGQVFEEYMHQHILERLGMAQSTFDPEQVDPELRVTPHVQKGLHVEVSELATWSRERAPSVGLFSNLADLLRWAQANLNRGELDGRRILQASSFDELWKSQVHLGWGDEQQDEGLGWFLGANNGHPVSHYLANDVGFHNAIYLAPEDNAGVVMLGNQFTANGVTPFYAYSAASLAFWVTVVS